MRSYKMATALMLGALASSTFAQDVDQKAASEAAVLKASPVEAAQDSAEAVKEKKETKFFNLTIDELLGVGQASMEVGKPVIYGFVRENVERVFNVPYVGVNGATQKATDPLEWADVDYHLYGSARITEKSLVLFQIAGEGSDVELRNAWGNLAIKRGLQFRLGKMYRRFGLFNPKLDQTPTFVGIEPPELLDKDHLLVPRHTTLAVHGERQFGEYSASYWLDTGNGEAGAEQGVIPLGWDLRLKGSALVLGTSGYKSSMGSGATTSTVGLGEGSPRGGVLPWMSGDDYSVYGAFAEYQAGQFLLQGAFWRADHHAERDPASILTLAHEAGLNDGQRRRFFGANASLPDGSLTEDHVIKTANYAVQTAYARVSYTKGTSSGTLTPYLFLDWMKHPEAIGRKKWGGDNEAGYADDGKFWKPSIGVVFNPSYQLALKLDTSAHIQNFNGRREIYPEVRFDISFAFTLLH